MRKWPVFWLVVALVFGVFSPALRNGLLSWDDAAYIVENVHIRALSFETVRWAFTEFYLDYWSPLSWLSLAVDRALWGPGPVGYHFTNVALHALNAGLFFLVAVRLLEAAPTAKGGTSAPGPVSTLACAMLAALAFALHPLRVESVAWATERKDVLSAFLGLAAVLAYLRYAATDGAAVPRDGPARFLGSRRYWVVVLLYAASLGSKATFVTMPIVLLILDWFPLGRFTRDSAPRLLLEKVPPLALALTVTALTVRAMAPSLHSLELVGPVSRIVTAATSILRYLRLTVLPVDVSPVYFHGGPRELDAGAIAAIAALLAITAFAAVGARRRPAILAAWLLFLVTLAPVSGLVQSGPQEMAARFTYVPSLSLAMLAALGLGLAGRRLSSPTSVRALWAGAALALAALAALTVRDLGAWRDDIALWSRVIETQPVRYGKAYYTRAVYLTNAGRYAEALSDVDEALAIAQRKRHPGAHEVHAQRGRILGKMRRYPEAIDDLTTALSLGPEEMRAMYLLERGSLFEAAGERTLAERDYVASGALAGAAGGRQAPPAP